MINDQARQALIRLQMQASKTGDSYLLERAEHALDEVVRNHENGNPAAFQIRSALANAGKAIAHRRSTIQIDSSDYEPGGHSFGQQPEVTEGGYALVEIRQWIDSTSALTASERRLVLDLVEGDDAEAIASRCGLPVARIRERISRVRKKARSAYDLEVAA